MNELIPFLPAQNGTQAVSARVLYEFLEIGTDFTTWCNRMFEYGFEANIDFTPILGKSPMGRPSTDYALTLDCAKEISMIQRSEKGKTARLYFIECEKRLKGIGVFQMPKSLPEALRLYALEIEAREEAQRQLEEAKPKVDFYEAVTGSKDAMDLSEVAKTLNWPNMGRNKLFEFLRNHGVLRDNNQPYQSYVDNGWMRLIESKFQKPNGDIHINLKTVVFQAGLQGIRKLLVKHIGPNTK